MLLFFHGPAKSSSHQLKSVVNIPGFTGFQHVSTIQPGSHPHHSTSFSYAAPRKEVQITTNTVVRGDIVVLGTGDVVPADCDPGRFWDDCNVYNSVYIYIILYIHTYIYIKLYYCTIYICLCIWLVHVSTIEWFQDMRISDSRGIHADKQCNPRCL